MPHFSVILEFTNKGHISSEDRKEIADNILRAIDNEIGGMGIAPEDSEYYTTLIQVHTDTDPEYVAIKSYHPLP